MTDIDEQIEQTPIADPSLTDEIRNKGGRPKGSSKPKIDWYARREAIWEKMNAAIDSGSPAPGDDKRANCKWGFLLIRKPDTESLVGSVCQDPRELPDGISLIAAEMGGSTSVFIGIRRAV